MQENLSKLINFKDIQRYLNTYNMHVEVFKDIDQLRNVIESIPKDDYPYQWDAAFDSKYLEKNDYFCILLYQDDSIIGTYAARHMNLQNYLYAIRKIFCEDKVSTLLKFEQEGSNKNTWYSSLQWISNRSRGKRIGIFLDYIKKSLVFELYNADYNYAIHKEALCEYHVKKLNYDYTEWLMTVVNGNIGSAGDSNDKIYYLCNTEKNSWLNKQNELYNNYL